jgi:hypothetical protein
MHETARQQKITFGEMRESGIDRVLVYCADNKCSHWVQMSADRWPDYVAPVRLQGLRQARADVRGLFAPARMGTG